MEVATIGLAVGGHLGQILACIIYITIRSILTHFGRVSYFCN